MRELNIKSKGLLFDTCKHIRRIRDEKFSSYYLSGIVIDAFVCEVIDGWRWREDGDGSISAEPLMYENHLLSKFQVMKRLRFSTSCSPGSGQKLDWSNSIGCLEKVINYMVKE
jgi:hypothetical protein